MSLLKDNEFSIIKGDRHSIGYKKPKPDYQFKEHTIEVTSGLQVYLTTDDYLDQNGGQKGFSFGKKRFNELLLKYQSECMVDQKEMLLYGLNEYQLDEERNDDDVTVVGLKF